ncbi:hypothetical protein DCAR_0414479 [Daucus carota subsp. sativus]|uniref:Uncharacterized protein n=1 Tax=Daucus carota subsp. sativus TaxID=79200 RepID=A0A175YDE0_DAUCS|nr:PREDICTED: flavonol synthase/flavanone 3-hydroxylase-like [Daucus carota subsp. sativus]WOG95176.1 hypothetical protein DCAR_0414479 [Daucus carota subsp. sativus]
MGSAIIPTIDLSPLIAATEYTKSQAAGTVKSNRPVNKIGTETVKKELSRACREYGFFQIVNHGIPVELLNRSLELAKTFYGYPDEEKMKRGPGAPPKGGFTKNPQHLPDRNEFMYIFEPGSPKNVIPENPPQFKEVLEDIFPQYRNLASLIEDIINDCLELPPNFLKEYNDSRDYDHLLSLHYLPASDFENSGKVEHEDGNIVTFVLQDDVGGLEVLHKGKWIPVPPAPSTLVVNVGDTLQVLSNNRFKSATHRVVRQKGTTRNSYAFFYVLDVDKWVEPLPHFTTHIGEPPQYRGFYYKDFVQGRIQDRLNPPARLEDRFCIKHYAISTSSGA